MPVMAMMLVMRMMLVMHVMMRLAHAQLFKKAEQVYPFSSDS